MNNLLHADIFFFVSTIGFIVCFILFIILAVYLIQIARSVSAIAKKVERDVDTIGDTAKEFVLDLQNNSLFSLFFRKRKKYTKRELSD